MAHLGLSLNLDPSPSAPSNATPTSTHSTRLDSQHVTAVVVVKLARFNPSHSSTNTYRQTDPHRSTPVLIEILLSKLGNTDTVTTIILYTLTPFINMIYYFTSFLHSVCRLPSHLPASSPFTAALYLTV